MATTATWDAAQQALWARIDVHPIGGSDGATALFERLRREQRWSAAQAAQALREYRRFVFLCCVAPDEMTPSKAIDAVWHLHLLFTRDYWDGFCAAALQRPLHHAPALGSSDAPRHRRQYAHTRAAYARFFGPPPAAWWPDDEAARAAPRRAPLRRRLAALAAALGLPGLAAARPSNPLDWNGQDFIALYLGLMLAVLVVSLLLRRWLRRRAEPPLRHVGALDPYEIAYLAGGSSRALDAAVAELHRRGVLEWDSARGQLRATGEPARLDPPLAAVAAALAGATSPGAGQRAAYRALEPVRDGLERRGLWLSAGAARRSGWPAALPALALLAFGAAKIAIGMSRDRPVLFLVILSVITALLALSMFAAAARPTRAGAAEFEKARRLHPAPDDLRRRPDQLALAVALGGTAILAGTALAAYHEARAAAPSDSSSGSDYSSGSDSGSSDSGGGDSGGSSGCGGCGGGGGGD
jgi:uncharacterized protein (TIGR04222 family)